MCDYGDLSRSPLSSPLVVAYHLAYHSTQSDDARVKNIVWWYGTFEHITHAHHDIEEHVLFPFFAELGATLPPRLAADHVALVTGLTRIRLELATFAAASKEERPALLAALVAYVATYTATFIEHLHEEEDTTIPNDVMYITSKAVEKRLMDRILKRINMADTPLELA
jgi:hemerythrin-like domain-containing protein